MKLNGLINFSEIKSLSVGLILWAICAVLGLGMLMAYGYVQRIAGSFIAWAFFEHEGSALCLYFFISWIIWQFFYKPKADEIHTDWPKLKAFMPTFKILCVFYCMGRMFHLFAIGDY